LSIQQGVNTHGRAARLLAVCIVVVGCSTQSRFDSGMDAGAAGGGGSPAKAGAGGAGGAGGKAGAGAGAGGVSDSDALGAACTSDTDCGRLSCDREIKRQVMISGAPQGQVDATLFPGGSCTPLRLAAFDPNGVQSCDPGGPRGAQGCGPNGVCVVETVSGKTMVACRKACEPSAKSSGCDRKGYTCDFTERACIEGCSGDVECRLQIADTNGDGQPDSTVYDKTSGATCDDKTARCTHPAGAAAIGAGCMRDDDCGADAACITATTTLAGHHFPGGFCTQIGCKVAGRECGASSVCEPLRPVLGATETDPLCLTRCTVGAETGDLQRGPSGHAVGCRPGYRCAYNGGSGAQAGVCVGGEYNGVSANNVGGACSTNTDCYSPFGAGRCLKYALPDNKSSQGTCTLLDCNSPGLPMDVCGSGNECVGTSGDEAQCTHDCTKASECRAGFACSDDDGIPETSKVCYPVCETLADCRPNERCQLYPNTSVGQCVLQ
jgi:hypothetical protein